MPLSGSLCYQRNAVHAGVALVIHVLRILPLLRLGAPMSTLDRRNFLTMVSAAAAGLSLADSAANAAAGRKPKIKIGQIGTGHAHASGVFKQLKQASDFEDRRH